ncbi:OLC1v1006849C1 [Oldenlandia corymbosa var. corymbosa]|uniref:OLC1v1006849C1 n=1 Tax=Oldenlandia corymbosa var. corymbosa TaxID=529605 RepID=A0AAV1DI00_OLDCO|nr:OLC1v1006849C1 [Oldenlandia corymbosa var. corymbosa]
MGPKTCKVCDKVLSKYKCPACLTPYCSLPCFKKHKETPCAKPVSVSQKDDSSPAPAIIHLDKPYYVDEPSEVLQHSQLESIASSSEIRDLLKDEKLQTLISSMVTSAEPEKELSKAMQMDDFRIFSEKVLQSERGTWVAGSCYVLIEKDV